MRSISVHHLGRKGVGRELDKGGGHGGRGRREKGAEEEGKERKEGKAHRELK